MAENYRALVSRMLPSRQCFRALVNENERDAKFTRSDFKNKLRVLYFIHCNSLLIYWEFTTSAYPHSTNLRFSFFTKSENNFYFPRACALVLRGSQLCRSPLVVSQSQIARFPPPSQRKITTARSLHFFKFAFFRLYRLIVCSARKAVRRLHKHLLSAI